LPVNHHQPFSHRRPSRLIADRRSHPLAAITALNQGAIPKPQEQSAKWVFACEIGLTSRRNCLARSGAWE
jgi:hypothetical protein